MCTKTEIGDAYQRIQRAFPACYDQCCRNSQVIGDVEAVIGGCTPQQAVDLAHTDIRIQITILRKDSDCFARGWQNVDPLYRVGSNFFFGPTLKKPFQ